MRIPLLSLASIACILFSGINFAEMSSPLRNPEKLFRPRKETVHKLANVKVVLADYDLLRRDFVELKDLTKGKIDEWLIKNGGYIAQSQYLKGEERKTNSKIEVIENEDAIAYRPDGYGRSLVFKVGESGLLDAKGAGSLFPYCGSHSNGLATLSEMIQEFIIEKVVDKIFKDSGSKYNTVGTYAVLDIGFNVTDPQVGNVPAGMVLRQGHERESCGMRSVDPITKDINYGTEVEQILRRYGISSGGENFFKDPNRKLFVNLQRAKDGSIIDFGTYIIFKDFTSPLWWFDRNGEVYGQKIILDPNMPDYVHPDPKLQLPVRLWGAEQEGDVWVDRIGNWAEKWACKVRDNSRKRRVLEKNVQKHFGNLERRWKKARLTNTEP